MKSKIKLLTRRFGFDIKKYPVVDAEIYKLLTADRFKEGKVRLFDKDFTYADARSLYYSYLEIFKSAIYSFPCEKEKPFIIDCGANYGLSILFFKNLYPNAEVIGIEADPYIFEVLKKNVETYNLENVTLINKAVWKEETTLLFRQEHSDSGRVVLDSKDKTIEVQTLILDSLVEQRTVDMLKMDIEGAEVEVIPKFGNISQVDRLFIEFHSFPNKSQGLTSLLSQLEEAGFRYQIQSIHSSPSPFQETVLQYDMDLQLNIFAYKQGL